MVAIVADPAEQDEINGRALALAESAADPRARQWRASLLNNIGWSAFERGELAAALDLFGAALEARLGLGKPARDPGRALVGCTRAARAGPDR